MTAEQKTNGKLDPAANPDLFDDEDCRPENTYPDDGQLDELLPDDLKKALYAAKAKNAPPA